MTDALVTGVTYWPADTGPHLWLELDEPRVRADLARIRDQGFATVRLPLAWDAFMSSDRFVNPVRLSQLGRLLDAAAGLSLELVPVLFAQSVGDCVILPEYAIVPQPRRGVRVLSGGRVRPGGPRDMWADPLMLEMGSRWLEGLLEQCGGHPALAAWDLGHDPASTVRPLRFADLRGWVELMAGQVHEAGDRCWLTLGAGDLLSARGVRLQLIGDLVDSVGLVAMPQLLPLGDGPLSARAVLFLCGLAQRLLEDGARLLLSTGVATTAAMVAAEEAGTAGATDAAGAARAGGAERGGPAASAPLTPRRQRRSPRDPDPVEPEAAAEHARLLLRGLPRAGVGGALAWTWTGVGPRALAAPPFDRFPSLGRSGIVDARGDLSPVGEAWAAAARTGGEPGPRAPWPPRLDASDYYAHLPESGRELFSSWLDVPEHDPAILG